MTLKEAVKSKFPAYYMFGKVCASENRSFRLEYSEHREDKMFVAPEALEQIVREREQALHAIETLAAALRQFSPETVNGIFEQKIEG